MENGLVVSDAGPIFSLVFIHQLSLLDEIFEQVFIPKAVWIELTRDESSKYYPEIVEYFHHKVKEIQGRNDLALIMDYGESESVVLYREIDADFLLIDDRKARKIAENLRVNCVGTLGLLITGKEKGLIKELRPLFKALLENKRFYTLSFLNGILARYKEEELDQ
jgi:predicted nucleic acid-binding protein